MSAYGSKQKPTTRKTVSLDEEQAAAISGNKENLGNIKSLAAEASSADTDTLINEIEKFFPGFSSMTGKASEVIGNYLSGTISDDMQRQMADRAAARGISTGTAGSQFSGFQELRNFGTTMMAMQQQGVQMVNQAAQIAKSMVNPMSVTSLFQTPAQRAQLAQSEADRAASIDSHNAAIAAAPDPGRIAALEDARMRQIAGIQTRNAVNMQNSANYAASMGYSSRPRFGSLRDRLRSQGLRTV